MSDSDQPEQHAENPDTRINENMTETDSTPDGSDRIDGNGWEPHDAKCDECGASTHTNGQIIHCDSCTWWEELESPTVERLTGGYWYGGDGEWARIESINADGNQVNISTQSVSHETVPQKICERAYDAYDGNVVLLEPRSVDADANRSRGGR